MRVLVNLHAVAASLFALALSTACGSSPVAHDDHAKASGPSSCEPLATPAVAPLGEQRSSSTLALGRFLSGPKLGHAVAFVADSDEAAVVVIDVDDKKVLFSLPLQAKPSQLLLLADGRLLVTLSEPHQLALLQVSPSGELSRGCALDLPEDPRGIAVSPDGERVVVASGLAANLAIFDKQLQARVRVPLAREPRAVLIESSGKLAFITHAIGGRLSVVDLTSEKAQAPLRLTSSESNAGDEIGPVSLSNRIEEALQGSSADRELQPGERIANQGYSLVETQLPPGRLLLPQVLVDPGDKASPNEQYGGPDLRHAAVVSVVDEAARRMLPNPGLGDFRSMLIEREQGAGGGQPPGQCLLPRAAVLDHGSGTLLVACVGIDTVIAYDALSVAPADVERGRQGVGMFPTGLAVDAAARRALVWSEYERTLDIIDLRQMMGKDPPTKRNKIELERPKKPMALATMLGRQIFHSVGDVRVASDGVACASCHPDGRDDGLTWASRLGPRRTRPLDGVARHKSFGWDGEHKDLGSFVQAELENLGGKGLRGVQEEALLTYLGALPKSTSTPATEGQKLFVDKGCAACHEASTPAKHDIGSRSRFDRRSVFSAPDLRGVAHRAPFFHDGRYATLVDVLREPHHKQGAQLELSEAERTTMLRFMESY